MKKEALERSPRTKRQWRDIIEDHRLWLSSWAGSWIERLPTGAENNRIPPVPLVLVRLSSMARARKVLRARNLTLQDSTLNLLPGYHHPTGYCVKALTRPSSIWLARHPEG